MNKYEIEIGKEGMWTTHLHGSDINELINVMELLKAEGSLVYDFRLIQIL